MSLLEFQPVLFDFYSPPTICNANSSKHLTLKKRTPFAFQNESFCILKGVLLHFKTSPFATQKESFCKTPRFSSRYASIFFAIRLDFLCPNTSISLVCNSLLFADCDHYFLPKLSISFAALLVPMTPESISNEASRIRFTLLNSLSSFSRVAGPMPGMSSRAL